MEFHYSVAGSIFFVVIFERILAYRKALKAINHHPGHRRAISASSLLSGVAPRISGIFPGANHLHEDKTKYFEQFGWDVISDVSWFGKISTTYIISDAGAIKEIIAARATFPKPVDFYAYKALSIYGHNVVSTEGDVWRRFKKLVGPAFNERNNRLVWDESIRVTAELLDEVWEGKKKIEVDHCLDLTLPMALYILRAAVFGNRMSWKEDKIRLPGYELTFRDALHYVALDTVVKAAVPNWTLNLSARLRRTRLAYSELKKYMDDMIEERAKSRDREHRDLLSNLLASSKGEDEGRGRGLSTEDILGNIFIILVAGHETTAHTLCFAFALLALYQEEQERLYEEVVGVLEGGRLPVYEDMAVLPRALAVLYETLRLFPSVTGIPKVAAEDTILTIGNQSGEATTIPVPKGTNIIIDTPGLHHNPRYWADPLEFRPDRFMTSDWSRDAFLAFSSGARSCLGRKFTETESVAILAMMVSRYRVTIKEEPDFAGESFEEKRARVTACTGGLTLAPVRVPLVFTRRDH